jgi:hypothetical protein
VGVDARDHRSSGPRERSMPSRRKPKPAERAKEREGACKPRKPQARKSAHRPLRRAPPSAPVLLAEMERQARHRDRRAVVPPASQGEPVTPLVMWTVYKHPKDYPGEYVARKFVITEDSYRPSNESISSRSLRDVRNVLRSLYRGLIQLKRPPDDEPHVVEVWL